MTKLDIPHEKYILSNTSKGHQGEMLDRRVNLVILAKNTTSTIPFFSLALRSYACDSYLFKM